MNNARRKIIKLAIEEILSAKNDLADVLSEEEDALDSVNEHFPDSERAEIMEENVDNLNDAIDSLDEVIEALQEVIDR